MKTKKLPYKKFLESFKYAPRPAVNLLIERDTEVSQTKQTSNRNGKFRKLPMKEALLTKRKKPPFAGSWHLPGSFVLKGESLMNCIRRVTREELGIEIEKQIDKKNIRLVGAFDDITGDPRGHVVDLVYRCHIKTDQKRPGLFQKGLAFPKPVGDSAEIRFFKKLPANIGFNHRDTLVKLGYK